MDDPNLARIRAICLDYPEAVENSANEMARPTFRVRDKIFAWYMDNHHGDGRLAVWMKAGPGVQGALVGAAPERFFVPPYVGSKGWVAVRLDGANVDWDELTDLLEQSYRMTAPKRLAAQLDLG